LGREGERLAARFLRKNGYRLLYRNYRPRRGGEVDLVCRDKAAGELVFVEVKTRRRTDFGDPADAVNLEKQKLIIRGAMTWMRLLDNPAVVFRFDIIEVIFEGGVPRINHIKDAFQLPEAFRL
jgi:putative endonuclease